MDRIELRAMREKQLLTQEDAAALVYISTSKWRKWEAEDCIGKSEKNNYKARTELFEYKIKELSDAGN